MRIASSFPIQECHEQCTQLAAPRTEAAWLEAHDAYTEQKFQAHRAEW